MKSGYGTVGLKARRSAREGATERGSILVEFGLAVPLLAALVLGGVSTGLAYNTNNSLNNGAREAARYAATLPVEGDLNVWLNTVADAAVEAASGELEATVPDQRVCIAYVYPDGSAGDDRTISLVEEGGSRSVLVGGFCFADARPNDERRVQVRLERTADVQAVVYSRTVELEAHSVVRFERTDS